MQILVATLRGAVHQQHRAAAYAALLPSLVGTSLLASTASLTGQALRHTCPFLNQRLEGSVKVVYTSVDHPSTSGLSVGAGQKDLALMEVNRLG